MYNTIHDKTVLFNRLMFKYIARGSDVKRGEQYSLALFSVWIKAVISVLMGRNPEFVMTPKERQAGRFLNLIRIQLYFIIFSFAAVLFFIIMIISGTPYSYLGLGVNLFWAIFNIINLSTIVKAAVYSLTEGWNPQPDPELLNTGKN